MFSSLKGKQEPYVNGSSHTDNGSQYHNLCLNLNDKCSYLSPVQSHNKSYNDNFCATSKSTDATVFENCEEKEKQQFLNFSSKASNFVNLNGEVGEREAKKLCNKDSSSTISINKSTLSLHIVAYENFGETTNDSEDTEKEDLKKAKSRLMKKSQTPKQIFSGSASKIQNAFEFPRQQGSGATTPEVMQFKAQQKVADPNNTSTLSGSTAISSISIHHLPHESKFVLKPNIRGLAKRMIYRLVNYHLLDGFSDNEICCILDSMYDLLKPAPAFIHMPAPVVIFGDTHGQFVDLLRIIDKVGSPPKSRYLFLGDYCDRGRKSIEILMLLFCYKLLYPKDVQILRGNHECSKMNRLYGFYEECRRARGTQLWKKFQVVFNEMPLCCLVADRIITMHGGISPDIKGMETLYKLKKPRNHAECDTGVALDLMWSDPAAGADSCCSWQFNKMRNASWMFGTESVKEFCRLLDIDMIVRAHEVCKNGHLFYCDKLLCTVFSAPNYCGSDGNSASVMKVSADLTFSFLTFKPKLDKNTLSKEKIAELEKQSKNADVKSPNPTLHKTVLPDRSHEVHDKTKQSPSQTATTTTTAAAMQTTQTVTTAVTPSTSNESTVSSITSGPITSYVTPSPLSSLTSTPKASGSTANLPSSATSSSSSTSQSTPDNSVTAVTTPTTSTGSIT